MKLIPINDHVLIEPVIVSENAFENAVEKKLDSGKTLFLAKGKEDAKALRARCDKGKVLQVAENVTKINVGDQVLLYPYAHTDFEYEGKMYAVAKEEDILLVLRNE